MGGLGLVELEAAGKGVEVAAGDAGEVARSMRGLRGEASTGSRNPTSSSLLAASPGPRPWLCLRSMGALMGTGARW